MTELSAELKVVKNSRTGVRGAVTKALQNFTSLPSLTSQSEVKFRSYLKSLQDYRAQLRDLNHQLQPALGAEEAVADITRSLEYDEQLATAIHSLEAVIEVYVSQQSSSRAKSSTAESGAPTQQAKLPKVELMKFGGNPLEWEAFWDDFTNSVDVRTNLTIIDKFKLLKTALTDDALKIAEGYMLTSANYDQVKENLKERFGDPEIAIFAHFEALLAVTPANHDLQQLRLVYDTCEAHIRSLVALGLSEETFGLVFTPILLSKLPKFVRMELYRKNGSRKWSLTNLREILRDEIKARDKSERSYAGSSPGKPTTKGDKVGRKGGPTSTLLTDNQPRDKNRPGTKGKLKNCAFCDLPHASWKCRTYPDADSRREQARGKCSICLQKGHLSKACSNRAPCFYCAKDNHHSSLCFQKFGSSGPAGNSGTSGGSQKEGKGGSSTETSTVINSLNAEAPEFFPNNEETAAIASSTKARKGGVAVVKSAKVSVVGQQSSATVQVVFDDCSTTSFISNNLAKSIGAKCVGSDFRSVGHFGTAKRKTQKWRSYEIYLRGRDGSRKPIILYGLDQICPPIRIVPLSESQIPVISSLDLAQPLVDSPVNADVDILIGLDYYNEFLLDDEVRVNGLIFRKSLFGFLASGFLPCGRTTDSFDCGNQLFISSDLDPATHDLERMWRDEEAGLKDDPVQRAVDDQVFVDFKKSIERDSDVRYMVRWPYRSSSPDLCNTFDLAQARLRVLVRKLSNNDSAFESFEQTFQDQVDRGIIEEAPSKPQGAVFYLPHHAVIKPDRVTTKVRIVYDASAKVGRYGNSLNECLHRGPLILEDLLGLVSRFRFHRVAFMADIEKAFHTVGLQEDQRDVTRFLWVRDRTKPVRADNLIVYRFARVPFGCVSSSFLLSGTIVYHLQHSGTDLANEILSFLYVDNLIGGRSSPKLASEFFIGSKGVFQQARMNLRQWYSNSSEFYASIPEQDKAQGDKASCLGLIWDLKADTLSCKAGPALDTEGRTKRQILQGLSSFYDPMGWFSPVSIAARILMQKIWIEGAQWDENLATKWCSEWEKIQAELIGCLSIPVSRFLVNFPVAPSSSNVQIHAFCDASGKAYATAIFIRYFDAVSNRWRASLLLSRARVAPAKSTTIPKLELMAARIGALLLSATRDCLRISDVQTFLWSDSTCVLAWLSGTTSNSVFVANRARQIASKNITEIRYVPTADNPADINSRGAPLEKLARSDLWWHGPSWLGQDSSTWPVLPQSAEKIDHLNADTTEADGVSAIATSAQSPNFVIDPTRFSSLQKLLRVTAYVLRFARRQKSNSVIISAEELEKAQLWWDRNVQAEYFGSISALQRFRDLRPYKDEAGLVRCRGRFAQSGLSKYAKNPVLLPNSAQYVRLLIHDLHEKGFHCGAKHTLSLLRQRYWIPSGMSTVKYNLHRCLVCRHHSGGHYKLPEAPSLPEFRSTIRRPFSCIGLDYLGPLYVSGENEPSKVWVCLFTCTVTRAIHLELTQSLSAVDFLFCLRRFVARFSAPEVVVSDNARQFTATEKILRKEWFTVTHDETIQSYAAKKGIHWVFIPELSPWMGGFYERLVKPVKIALKRSLGKALVSVTELTTILYEIASILNSRPLTYVGGEFEKHYLCPLDFISHGGTFLMAQNPPSDGDFDPNSATAGLLSENFRQGQRLLNHFWSVWQSSYLTSLREAHHHAKQRNVVAAYPEIGHVVLIKDPQQVRAQWKIGRITKLFESRDGQVRSVEVVLPSQKTLRRPIKLLYPLELSEFAADSLPTPRDDDAGSSKRPLRPGRRAAERARAALKAQAEEHSTSDSD